MNDASLPGILLVVMVIINNSNMFQYPWNPNELYLFKANVAYALRQYYQLQKNESLVFTSVSTLASSHHSVFLLTFDWLWLRHFSRFSFFTCRTANILSYEETRRVSFYIVVTNPTTPTSYIPKTDVEAAIRWGARFIQNQRILALCAVIRANSHFVQHLMTKVSQMNEFSLSCGLCLVLMLAC